MACVFQHWWSPATRTLLDPGCVDVTTPAPRRSRGTHTVPVDHIRVTGHADALPSPGKDTTLEAVRCSAWFGPAWASKRCNASASPRLNEVCRTAATAG